MFYQEKLLFSKIQNKITKEKKLPRLSREKATSLHTTQRAHQAASAVHTLHIPQLLQHIPHHTPHKLHTYSDTNLHWYVSARFQLTFQRETVLPHVKTLRFPSRMLTLEAADSDTDLCSHSPFSLNTMDSLFLFSHMYGPSGWESETGVKLF